MKYKIKDILKTLALWICTIYFFSEAIYSYKISDPWGLTFSVVTIPCIIICIIFLKHAFLNTMQILKFFKK